MAVTQRGGGFQAAFMVAGNRYRQQFDTLQAAEDWETETRLALRRGDSVPLGGRVDAPSTGPASAKLSTLGALFDYVREHKWEGKKSAEFLIRNARMVVEHFGRGKRVAEIGPFEIDGLIKALKDGKLNPRGDGNSAGGINRKLAALSRMMTIATDHGVIPRKPKIERRKEPEGRLRFLDVDEEIAIVRQLAARDEEGKAYSDLTTFLVDTGLRVGEALSLAWTEVKGAQVVVLGEKAKSSKTRIVPLTGRAQQLLARLHQTEPTGPFAALRYHSYRNRFETVTRRLKLDDVVIHSLRHTTASRLVIKGVDIYRVMKFMGHSDVRTTQRYAHLAPDSLSGLADVLEPAAPARQMEVA
jgi:integrase